MAISPQLVGAGLSAAGALFGGGGDSVSFRPGNVMGPLGSATYNKKKGYNLQLAPELESIQQMLFGRGGDILSNLTDPSRVAQDYFGQMMGMLAPEQAKARSSLESRLFAQGRLGGTGGINQFSGLLRGQEDARTKLAANALFQGMNLRGQEIGQAGSLFTQGIGIGNVPLQYANLGMGMGEGALQASMYNASNRSNPLQAALTSAGAAFGGMDSWGMGGTDASNLSGIAGVTSGSQQDQMLFSQWDPAWG